MTQEKMMEEFKALVKAFRKWSIPERPRLQRQRWPLCGPQGWLYQFAANLHLKLRHKGSRERMRQNLRKRDFVKIQICIDSLCQKNMSLEYITGLDTNSRIFTVSVTGLLEMKSGQYASVYVDNASRMTVKIQGDSDFTGILFGV
ncbi:hypothetical protein C0Q70_02365 [Pomacea canaliculata]|uniref:C1q domain-containing protein n=1 Tax=Pomacea canaliculata TaxID=400727 RepID=A0A2T7PPP9_POMCA|nr:hypothetical protein C0Q70_02365 [Pomacea canaliculata]